MAPPNSASGLTRSQARAGTPSISSSAAMTPSGTVAAPGSLAFSKAGRRVLAELTCNDSPIVGLLPEGSPFSAKRNPDPEHPPRSRKVLLENSPALECSGTPLGENLLRSQVQLLLQKVGSNVHAHINKPPCVQHSKGCFVLSPTTLAAPTPLNTPLMAPTMPPEPLDFHAPSHSLDVMQSAEGLGDLCSGSPQVLEPNIITAAEGFPTMAKMVNVVSSASDCSAMAVCDMPCTTDTPRMTPSQSEGSDLPSSAEIFHGRRVLHFEVDTPEKSSPAQDISDLTSTCHPSLVRELEDDEVSEWSIHVNVGSPVADKQNMVMNQVDVMSAAGLLSLSDMMSPSVHKHVQKMQKEQENCSKVHLLWDDDRVMKKVIPYRSNRGFPEDEEDGEKEGKGGEDVDEECYFYTDEEEEGQDEEGECEGDGQEYAEYEELCDIFKDMNFVEEERKGLPRGEGKHIRFLYGNDEDEEDEVFEAMEVQGEVDAMDGGGAIRLNGVPLPCGRHWRFSSDDGQKD